MSTTTFSKDPQINVISKEEFEVRVEKVFNLLWKTLSKSFGPYGAPTLIYNYPYSHATKDGFTIMKNLSMNASETILDQAIADMAADICGRLNYTVGDGTTSAVIATNSIYQSYRKMKSNLHGRIRMIPRNVIRFYEDIKELIIQQLKKETKSIQTDDIDTLWRNIYDIVFISSNGNEEISNYIADFYKELGCPSIYCELATDGVTKKKLIQGYQYELSLLDKLYVNSDDNTMYLDEADIIIFDIKVTRQSYMDIIKPLNEESRKRGRHLIVAAPTYDDRLLTQLIRRDLNKEYEKRKDINLVLTSYRASSAHNRKLRDDFAVLCNTTPITMGIQQAISEEFKEHQCCEIFNLDDRNEIPGLVRLLMDSNNQPMTLFNEYEDEKIQKLLDNGFHIPNLIEDSIRVGYVKDVNLGLKRSVFHTFFYNEAKYEAILKDAKDQLEDTEKKYKKLGTFTLDVSLSQQRYYALLLKMGIIEVGADSELSQKLLKDSVDDAIKAAASAFNHGIVKGCNLTLIRSILTVKEETLKTLKEKNNSDESIEEIKTLFDILYMGFRDVYSTVLMNAFDEEFIYLDTDQELPSYFTDKEVADFIVESNKKNNKIKLIDLIIDYSLLTGLVFDVTKMEFSDTINNSEETDEEILKATIDLISLLIVGNQMVITQKHNF